MALLFGDAEFHAAWRELHEPELHAEWELFTESGGVKIYRRYHQETGLYEYKVFGTLPTCQPDVCADVYKDLAYRKQWDEYVKELYENEYDGQTAIYWEVKYPFPLSNRDEGAVKEQWAANKGSARGAVLGDGTLLYVYVRECRELEVNGSRIWVVLAKSRDVAQCPEKAGVIRVKDYKQSLALESDGDKGTKVFMSYFDNPGGKIPTWLVNWAAKSGVPAFLTNMRKACDNYANYCGSKN